MLDRSLWNPLEPCKSTVAVAEAAAGLGGPVYASPHDVTLHAPQPSRSCGLSIGFGDGQIVEVKPAAAELLRPWEVRTVKDVLDLPAWPYGRLRIVIERRPLIEVMVEPV